MDYLIKKPLTNLDRMLLVLLMRNLWLPLINLIINFMESLLLICNRLEPVDRILLLILLLRLSIGEETILYRRVILLVVQVMVGVVLIIQIGPMPNRIIVLLIRIVQLLGRMQEVMQSLVCMLIMDRLILRGMLGDRLMDRMLWLILI